VVGKNNEVVLPGGIGEIYFRSPYISAGYFNDPEMTARVFIQNPFSQKTNDIVYCSGDLGQLLPNGHIQCLGRLDYQIKIGGYRIELGEIESALTKHPAIKDCVVTVLKNDILTAYFTCNKKIAAAELAAFLKGKLPGHMIPSFYVPLKKIPLNSSNKIDRAALPKPGRQHLAKSGNLIKARRELEQKILIVWRAVLNVEKIGVTDNFFDLGGNSLRAIQASSQLKKILGINLSAMMIFRYTTIASLVNYLENKEEGVVSQANKTIGKNEKNRILLSQAIKLLKKKKIKR